MSYSELNFCGGVTDLQYVFTKTFLKWCFMKHFSKMFIGYIILKDPVLAPRTDPSSKIIINIYPFYIDNF